MPAEPHRLLIMAGGTGGHVMPALAVAQKLAAKGVEIHWMGTPTGMESNLIKGHNIPFHAVQIKGLRGKGKLSLLFAPFKIVRAIWQSFRILRKVKPHTVMSMGGYVAGPGGIAAWLLRIPLILHEQNAISGLTNKLLAPYARRILTAFPKTFKQSKVVLTGNPVRESIIQAGELKSKQHLEDLPLRILVLGGSLGASVLNQVIPQALADANLQSKVDVWHQTGKRDQQTTEQSYAKHQLSCVVDEFIDDMAKAYLWADLVIARSGALTVAELAAVGVPSILIPFPYAVDDHQSYNARYLTDAGAAIFLAQSDLTAERLGQLISNLAMRRTTLMEMGEKGRTLSKPNATEQVAQFCIEEGRGKKSTVRS